MGSIVGAGVKIRHAKKTRAKSKASGKYLERNDNLPYLGYACYRDYLKCYDWKLIRKAKFEAYPNCQLCESVANCVHHYSYADSVLLGLYPDLLFSVCNKCHKHIEFTDEVPKVKRTLGHAQSVLRDMLTQAGKTETIKTLHLIYSQMSLNEKEARRKSLDRRDYIRRWGNH